MFKGTYREEHIIPPEMIIKDGKRHFWNQYINFAIANFYLLMSTQFCLRLADFLKFSVSYEVFKYYGKSLMITFHQQTGQGVI